MNAIGKAVAILEVLAHAQAPLSVGETARRAGLPKATAYRVLTFLGEHRLAMRHRSGYVLGERVQEWGSRSSLEFELRYGAMPRLLALHRATGLLVRLSMLANSPELSVTPVETLFGEPHRGLVERSMSPAPANATASGKVFLAANPILAQRYLTADRLPGYTERTITSRDRLAAELRAVRDRGVAIVRGEYLPELSCLAVPVYGPGRRVVAAIAIGGYGAEPLTPRVEQLARQEGAEVSAIASRRRRRSVSRPVSLR